MARVRIYLRGGQTIDAECDSFKATRDTANELTSLEWANLRPASLYLRLDAIDAITEVKGRR